jgi:hypothetical protein
MKTLDELKIIMEQPFVEGSNETKFVNKYGGIQSQKKRLKC